METERKVILEKNGEYYRVIGAVYNKNKELIHAHEIIESKLVLEALETFYQLNPDWLEVELKDNIKPEGV